jgi:hypothetical protein
MKNKIIGVFICILFFTTGVASATNILKIDSEKDIEGLLGDRLFIFGRMEKTNYTGQSIDFEVVSFVYIKDGKEITKIESGENIRFFAPMVAVLFRKMVIGFFSEYEILE